MLLRILSENICTLRLGCRQRHRTGVAQSQQLRSNFRRRCREIHGGKPNGMPLDGNDFIDHPDGRVHNCRLPILADDVKSSP